MVGFVKAGGVRWVNRPFIDPFREKRGKADASGRGFMAMFQARGRVSACGRGRIV